MRFGVESGTPVVARPGDPRAGEGSARARSLQGAAAGLAVTGLIAVLNGFVWTSAVPLGLLILGPLVAATRSRPRDVAVVAMIAFAAALLLGVPHDYFLNGQHLTRLLIVAVGGGMAIWIAGIRQDRERTADLLTAQAAVARILTSTDSLVEATPKLLAVLGQQLGWAFGALWTVDQQADVIRCVDALQSAEVEAGEFLDASRGATLNRGVGLPGRVWAAGRPVWVFDVTQDENFPRAAAAREAGLRAAFAFPIRSSSGILGAIEYLATTPREPDGQLLDLMDALGSQLGEHVERSLAKEAVHESDARKSAVVQSALDCIVTMDSDGKVVEFNPAAERTFGYTAREAIGQELAALIVPPDLREKHRRGLARYLATREPRMLDQRVEMRAMRKGGSELPVELTITSIDVEPPMFTGYLRDLSERHEAEELRNRLAAIVESSDDAILSKDHDLIIRSWNIGAQRLYGYTAEEAIGQSIAILIPEDRAGEEVEIFEAVLRDERVEHYETRRVRKDGSMVDVSLTVSPIRDPAGTIIGASVISRDISERKRIEAQRAEALRMEQEARLATERTARRASFLAEAQSVLSSSLEYEVTLRNLVRIAVPNLADWCAIDMVAPDGSLQRLAIAHVDPAKERLVAEIERRYPAQPDPNRGALRAVRTGTSELIREIPEELLVAVAQDEEHLRLIRTLGLRSAMVVPLLGRERTLGAITFAVAESDLLFDEDDLALAEDLAARAGTAVDNARLYGERSYIADTLQRSLMPERLPDIPGLDIAARYLAAGEATEVGGDFYDIYRSGESTWGVAIGDVRGKGPRAAVVTGLARYTLRTASLTNSLPSHVLGVLNEAMVLQPEGDRFLTVAYASVEPAKDGRVRMTLGVGGHPLPLLLHRDGSVEEAGRPGTLIGFVSDPEVVDETIELAAGDSLVFYTDGVSEARSAAGLFGEERLVDLLKTCAGLDAAAIAERIENDVLEFREGPTSDDIAVLVLRVRDRDTHYGAHIADRLEPAPRTVA
ncbi:MAG TPA: PAS domain S-box protein [Thermoleophilaceae bacterium]